MSQNYQFGISQSFPCHYLPEQQERLLIALDTQFTQPAGYDFLMANGFRRSGEQVYRPHCQHCNACQSIRILTNQFQPSSSQKRLLKRNQNFRVVYNQGNLAHYFPLYKRYINTLHKDGAMFPANFEQYQQFLQCSLCEQVFVEIYDAETLISVAITDILLTGLSAVYTFYDPEYRKQALGVFSILQQLQLAKLMGKQYLYLGYQIDDCQKMNYKTRYRPFERFVNNRWILINK